MASSYLKIAVLLWVDILGLYAVSTLVNYLTEIWNLNFIHASAIVNVFWGLSAIMPFTLQYIVDAFLSNYLMVLFSSFAYTVGLGFLWMSTPPVLFRATGTCSEYKPECIGKEQKVLFYTALILIAMGMAGHLTSLTFLVEEHKGSQEIVREKVLNIFAVILVPVVGAIAIPCIKPWSIRFGITTLCSLLATIVFLTGTYSSAFAPGSPLTTVFRVIFASASKAFHKCPTDPSQLYDAPKTSGEKFPHTSRLRCLDKAAIVLPNQSQENNKWKLCSVTEVEESKSIISMIPLCTTFFILGVVSSIGNTYFLEQANNMNQKMGHLKVPLTVLVLFRDQAKTQFRKCYERLTARNGSLYSSRFAAQLGIGVSMLFAVHCCITAAKVESRRLHVITSHNLLDKPDETIPMSMFWLLPQFFLLGGLDGIATKSVDLFFSKHGPPSMDRYMNRFAMAVFGVGTMGSVLSVGLVDKISSRHGNSSWFQDTLNESRLDKYYWLLTALSAANLVLYVLLAICYNIKYLRAQQT